MDLKKLRRLKFDANGDSVEKYTDAALENSDYKAMDAIDINIIENIDNAEELIEVTQISENASYFGRLI